MLGVVVAGCICAGSGCAAKGPAAGGQAPGEPGAGAPVDAPVSGGKVTFAEVYRRVLEPGGCMSGYCHGGGAGGLMMTDEASAYAALVGVKATDAVCGQTLRVSAGSVDESILWHRVRPKAEDGGKACARKMPGDDGLAPDEARIVKEWISVGAPR